MNTQETAHDLAIETLTKIKTSRWAVYPQTTWRAKLSEVELNQIKKDAEAELYSFVTLNETDAIGLLTAAAETCMQEMDADSLCEEAVAEAAIRWKEPAETTLVVYFED